MFPFFHIALPLLIFEIQPIKERYRVNRAALIIGSILPDIIDKVLELLAVGPGKGYAHTLIFAVISTAIIHFSFKKDKSKSFPFFIGLIIHFVLDFPCPVFYPFFGFEFIDIHEDPIKYWWEIPLRFPLVIASEIIGVFILIVIIKDRKLYSLDDILRYFKSHDGEGKNNDGMYREQFYFSLIFIVSYLSLFILILILLTYFIITHIISVVIFIPLTVPLLYLFFYKSEWNKK